MCVSVGGGSDEGADAAGHSGTAGAELRGEPHSSAGERRTHRETGQEGEGADGCRAEVFLRFFFCLYKENNTQKLPFLLVFITSHSFQG